MENKQIVVILVGELIKFVDNDQKSHYIWTYRPVHTRFTKLKPYANQMEIKCL